MMERCPTCGHMWYYHPDLDEQEYDPHCVDYDWSDEFNAETGEVELSMVTCYCAALRS